ncbi:MAG: hypothetical protein AAGG48_25530 [Planctomycetota bacterium]
MVADFALIAIAALAVAAYILQLWTGIAVAGWSGEQSLIEREKSPGPYWFVMTLQTALLILIPVLIAWYG